MERTKILAIIPARAGSKGFPNKNIADLNGKPLIAWTIDAAKEAGVFDRIILASDGPQIRAIGEDAGIQTFTLPESVTTDTSLMRDAVNVVLDGLKEEGYEPDYLMLLQPTSPLRTAAHIRGAVKLLDDSSDGVISVSEISNKPLKAFITNDDGRLQGLGGEKNFTNMPRALLPKLFMPNGALYLLRTDLYRAANNFFIDGQMQPYVMDEESGIDIDSPDDLREAAQRLARSRYNS